MPKVIGIVLLILVILGGYLAYQKKHRVEEVPMNVSIFTYAECLNSAGRKLLESYPQKCETRDGVEFIEEVKEPVDTSKWQTKDTGLGYSIKCPPYWKCHKWNDSDWFTVESNKYITSSPINFGIVTPENYQISALRHPNYKNPVSWLNDVKAKKADALKVYPVTIKSVEGSDQQIPPAYYEVSFDQIVKVNDGIIMPRKWIDDNYAVFPIGPSKVAIVVPMFDSFYQNPIYKALVNSITPN